ncbi:MAG: Crp/Fnr family transcriptional regulator [Chitinophagales bacterium]|jgi:CRP-like cAMP-binding protein|nr:Crp/Fnr family transcriptional regulator [Chitinophagales bacterium]
MINSAAKSFIEYLTSVSPLSAGAIHDIESCISILEVPKKEVFIADLGKSKYLYFIAKGIVRAYFSHDGKEITDWFGMENMVIGPVIRQFPVKDTPHRVEALEDGVFVRVSFADLDKLYQRHHEVERLGRLIAIHTMLHLQYKIDCLQLYGARERYADFLVRYPDLINRVALGFIASFLGMNQVTLSRIRRQQ